MRLNLGCGNDIRPDYLNVDFRQTHPSVVQVDLSKFPWPFDDGSADEILMLDFLEHFPYRDTERILLECYRVLRQGGELVVQVPDGNHLSRALTKRGAYMCNRCGDPVTEDHTACRGCGQSADDIAYEAMKRMYGGQDYTGNFHHVLFTQQSLWIAASRCGFCDAKMEEADHQFANWNLKMRLTKGDAWSV